jgi:dienelactone hydrolase
VLLRRVALAGAALALLAMPAAAAPRRFPTFTGDCARADFTSGGVHIPAERCGRATGGPAVVVLHGCGGFDTFDHELAADLPRFGIATLYVDYFAPTPPPGAAGFCHGFGFSGGDPFPKWQQVVVDAARTLRRRGYAHVGAVGWSLGAGVALAAAEDAQPFDAVAAFSAGASPETIARAAALPPTIFLDGGSHDIEPPANARALYAAAHRAGVPAALYVYGDGSHGWPGRQGVVGRAKAAAFLLRYLR